MEVKSQNLIHQSPDIQDNHVNGIKSKMDSLSIKPVVVHDSSCNGSKNGVNGCSGVCDTVVSSAKDSKSEVNAYLTPQRSAGTLSCSASSANAIARHAFFSDNKVFDHDSTTTAKRDTPSSVSSSRLPNDDAGNGIQGISPVSLSNGNQSTGLSTSDSIFTYNLTDESQDELDSRVTKCTSDVSDSQATSAEAGQSNSVSFSDSKYIDKSELIRSVIEKVYVHTVTYTVEDLLHFQKSRCLAEMKLSRSSRRTPRDSDKVKTPSSGQKDDFSHKKFTSRSLKDILKSMSPGSRRKKLLRSCGSLGSQSSNLGDSVDSASAKDEPIESFGTEEVPRKT